MLEATKEAKMDLKIGGGNRLQEYDHEDGRYKDNDCASSLEKDMENLVLGYLFCIESNKSLIRFPHYGIHDDDYCELFVKYIRKNITLGDVEIADSKMNYLLSEQKGRDKSKFLLNLGYNLTCPEALIEDICNGTDFKTLEYKKLTSHSLNAKAKTKLKGYLVATGWQINKDGTVRFITLIPGGDKIWK